MLTGPLSKLLSPLAYEYDATFMLTGIDDDDESCRPGVADGKRQLPTSGRV